VVMDRWTGSLHLTLFNLKHSNCRYNGSHVRPSLSHPNPKYFIFHPSHQIFRHMHGALNVGKKDN
jgi:hypothetical protein